MRILDRLFVSGPEIPCLDAADANDDAKVDISDPVRILGHLFSESPRLLRPPAAREAIPPRTSSTAGAEGR